MLVMQSPCLLARLQFTALLALHGSSHLGLWAVLVLRRHHYSFLDEDTLGALPQLLSEIALLLSPFLTGISICVCGILGCHCLFQDTDVTLGLLASAVTVAAMSMTSLSSHCFQDLCLQTSEASPDTFLLSSFKKS